jgi:hypothetical protein
MPGRRFKGENGRDQRLSRGYRNSAYGCSPLARAAGGGLKQRAMIDSGRGDWSSKKVNKGRGIELRDG